MINKLYLAFWLHYPLFIACWFFCMQFYINISPIFINICSSICFPQLNNFTFCCGLFAVLDLWLCNTSAFLLYFSVFNTVRNIWQISISNQVKVNTVLGSAAPPLTVKLVRAFSTGAKDSAIIDSKVSDESITYSEGWGLRIFSPSDAII